MNETQIEEEIEKYKKMGFEDESAKMQEIVLGYGQGWTYPRTPTLNSTGARWSS